MPVVIMAAALRDTYDACYSTISLVYHTDLKAPVFLNKPVAVASNLSSLPPDCPV